MISFSVFFFAVLLTFIIHYIGAISLSARIVATSTGMTASSLSLFNIITAIAQLSVSILAPLLTKSVEAIIINGQVFNIWQFRIIIFGATFGGILGAFSIPSIHRFMEKGVYKLYNERSILKLIIKSLRPNLIVHFISSMKMPNKKNYTSLMNTRDMPLGIIFMNLLVNAFISISILSCLYAGYLNPMYRTTALSLNALSISIGLAAMLLIVEPYNATITDKVIHGTVTHAYFRKYLAYVMLGRISRTL